MAKKKQQTQAEKLQSLLKEFGFKLKNPPANKDTLIKLLEQAAACMSEISQSLSEAEIESMQSFMHAIVKQELLKHHDKEVKLLVAACLCQIIRVTCPEPPYNDEVLKDIFELFVSTFSGLQNTKGPSFRRIVTMLETIAECKACIIMLNLECHELVNEMFRTFFAVVSDDHSESVITSMKKIMVDLLENCEDINEDLLLIIFSVLGKNKKGVITAARNLGMVVIKQCAGKLIPGIKQFIAKGVERVEIISSFSQIDDYKEVLLDIHRFAFAVISDIDTLLEIKHLPNKVMNILSAGDEGQGDIPKGGINNPQNLAEVQKSQSGAPLSPVTAGNQDDDVAADGVKISKKKRGRPFKTQPKNPETPLIANNQNGVSIALVNVEKVPNTNSVKGKRRKISGLSVESSQQDIQDQSEQHANGNSKVHVENSFIPMSDDQPHSSAGKKPSENSKSPVVMANDNGQELSFEKRSQHWETLESMKVFRLFPQTPHFHPLNSLKESARERQAIYYMVDFSCVFEDTFRLRIDHPRTEMEDKLETLCELESHGFDVGPIRNRLIELLSVKDEQERLDTLMKEARDKLKYQEESVESERYDKELELIDKQVNELLIKRDQCLKKKEKSDSELALLKAEIEGINEGMLETRRKFDQLASACVYDR